MIKLIPGMLKCVLGWCLPLNYQKLESPIPDGAVHVDINVEILDILSVNDKEFSITMSMYFSVMWQESRIWTNNSIEPGFWYPVSLEFLQDLWIPNVFIYNLKSFQNIAVLKRLAGRQRHCRKTLVKFSSWWDFLTVTKWWIIFEKMSRQSDYLLLVPGTPNTLVTSCPALLAWHQTIPQNKLYTNYRPPLLNDYVQKVRKHCNYAVCRDSCIV